MPIQDEDSQSAAQGLTRMIDFRIPLPWLLGGFSAIGWALVSMWFSLNQLVRDVAEMQATVKAGNTQAVAVAGELALLKFRVDKLESGGSLPIGLRVPAGEK